MYEQNKNSIVIIQIAIPNNKKDTLKSMICTQNPGHML